jgi:tight adherence protein C
MSVSFLAICGLVLLVSLFSLFFLLSRPSKVSALLAEVAQSLQAPASDQPRRGLVNVELLAKPLGQIRKLLGGDVDPQVARRLMRAGCRHPYHQDIFVGAKLLLPAIAGAAVAAFIKQSVVFWFVCALPVGFFAPEFWLARAVQKRCDEIRLSLPDALDLLSICLEVGLGLNQAIVKVGSELRISHPRAEPGASPDFSRAARRKFARRSMAKDGRSRGNRERAFICEDAGADGALRDADL